MKKIALVLSILLFSSYAFAGSCPKMAESVDAYRKNWIVETHSEIILLRLLKLIRTGKLKSEFLRVYYVDKSNKGGSFIKEDHRKATKPTQNTTRGGDLGYFKPRGLNETACPKQTMSINKQMFYLNYY